LAKLILNGATSGSISLESPAVSGTTTLTLPTTTDTLVGKTTTDTLTNKTLTSPAIDGTPTGVGVLTSGTAVASTSGTSIDFTGIPSWVKRITVMFNSVSTNGSAFSLIQLGTGGTATTTGYVSTTTVAAGGLTATTNSTSGFITYSNVATYATSGTYVFTNVSGNIWVGSSVVSNTTTTVLTTYSSGVVTLGGVLNLVRITTSNGTDTFDAGSINILYE
jgi:hypothetical protein